MADGIFSFGTLQLSEVQHALFGRSVPTTPDALAGHVVRDLQILDPDVIAMSGKEFHPSLYATGLEGDVVAGVILEVTPEELASADYYERVSYRRACVTLVSGRDAWVYLPKDA